MRAARETFLKFVADNLPDYKVVNVRFDKVHPAHSDFSQNAINIEFIFDRPSVSGPSGLQCSIDIIYDDELTAIDAATALWKLLAASEVTPLKSFAADVSNPTLLGTNLRWDSRQVKFNKLVSELFFRYNCHLYLYYYDPTMA
jgi:hypothetical protein